MIRASGKCMNRSPAMAAMRSPSGLLWFASEDIECPHALGHPQIDAHNRHGNDGEGGSERDVSGSPLQRVYGLPDHETRVSDNGGNDVVAERQREGED